MPLYGTRNGRGLYATRREAIRWQLPFGRWLCVDGREVLFDRYYSPICERSPGETPRLANPH